jgi:aminodeoxychorismate lyase
MLVFLNGTFVPENEAKISVFDRGFLYGDGLFDTLRVSRGKLFQWKEHFARLERGAAFLKIALPFAAAELHTHALNLISRNGMPDSVLRLNLSRGAGERGFSVKGANEPTVAMTLHAAAVANEIEPRWRLITSSIRLSSANPLAPFKTCNKLPQILGRTEADARGADEALLLNERGELVEGSASNLFWVRDGVVFTAPAGSGILPGITRASVFEICAQLGVKIQEQCARVQDLREADGVFLTFSSRGIVEADFLDDSRLGRSPLAEQIRKAHSEAVASNCG